MIVIIISHKEFYFIFYYGYNTEQGQKKIQVMITWFCFSILATKKRNRVETRPVMTREVREMALEEGWGLDKLFLSQRWPCIYGCGWEEQTT